MAQEPSGAQMLHGARRFLNVTLEDRFRDHKSDAARRVAQNEFKKGSEGRVRASEVHVRTAQ